MMLLLQQVEWLVPISIMFGLLIGSFLNVVIHRYPIMLKREWTNEALNYLREENLSPLPEVAETTPYNLMHPRSACPHCSAPINALQNIPVFSYLWLRGRCKHCQTSISPRYPFIEILTGCLFGIAAYTLGADYLLLATLWFSALLIAMSGIDWDHKLLPDTLTYLLLWSGLLVNVILGIIPVHDALIGAVAGYLSLWSVYWGFKLLTGKEGMGYGDFKLLAALGAWLGWQMLPIVIIISAVTGLLLGGGLKWLKGDQSPEIPFGPYLAIAGWVTLFYGPALLQGYLRLLGL